MSINQVKAGTLESSDLMVVINHGDGINLEINSIVGNQFGEQIRELVLSIIEENDLKDANVLIQDRGALDYAIRARVETAISRYKKGVVK